MVERPDGGFVCAYTAFDGKVGTLFVAPSPRPAALDEAWPSVRRHAVRAAADEVRRDRDRAEGRPAGRGAHDGRFWMYWGEGIYAATSIDLFRWTPVEIDDGAGPLSHLGAPTGPTALGAGRVERVPGPMALRPIATRAARPLRLAARRARARRRCSPPRAWC